MAELRIVSYLFGFGSFRLRRFTMLKGAMAIAVFFFAHTAQAACSAAQYDDEAILRLLNSLLTSKNMLAQAMPSLSQQERINALFARDAIADFSGQLNSIYVLIAFKNLLQHKEDAVALDVWLSHNVDPLRNAADGDLREIGNAISNSGDRNLIAAATAARDYMRSALRIFQGCTGNAPQR